ncbi:unnamed protein product [Didymodactylos carnosus]|uniref:Uncharacterized protein n=1 Tax=Didymodactylos carnosus TaxID=1234261 RepID=A0A8S2S4F7_9BILA|nr:unnamed protein product [Didymodactylos carnosus]CAF4202056.1 unnamed protein product [Didymodactylos carnosus]
MVGLLTVAKVNFNLNQPKSITFVDTLLKSVIIKSQNVFNEMKESDWSLVKDGCVNVLFCKLQIYSPSASNDTVSFLKQIPNVNQQRQIADALVKKILKLNVKISQNDWSDIFTMTSADTLTIECLKMTTTFVEFIDIAEKLLQTTIESVKSDVPTTLREILKVSQFTMTLENVLQFLEKVHSSCSNSLRNILENSSDLSSAITNYLRNMNVTSVNQLDHLSKVLIDYYNPCILNQLQVPAYIKDVLTKYTDKRADALWLFYHKWFNCFLCDRHYANTDTDLKMFVDLLDIWLGTIIKQCTIHSKFILSIDSLIQSLLNIEHLGQTQKPNRLEFFIQTSLPLFFPKEISALIEMAEQIAVHVKNQQFMIAYKKKFQLDIAENDTNKLNMKHLSMDSPFFRLLQRIKERPDLKILIDLIEICVNANTIEDLEVYLSTIVRPNINSLVSIILFEDCLKNSGIHHDLLMALADLWTSLEKNGVMADDIRNMRNHSPNERIQFREIWQYVRTIEKKKSEIEELFNNYDQEMTKKMNIKHKIQLCLETYCKQANDFNKYQNLLIKITQQLEKMPIQSVKIPNELVRFVTIAEQLNTLQMSVTWQNVFKRRKQREKPLKSTVKCCIIENL